MTEPLCGQKWFDKHHHDYSQEDIDALTMEVILPNNQVIKLSNYTKRKKVKDILKYKVKLGR